MVVLTFILVKPLVGDSDLILFPTALVFAILLTLYELWSLHTAFAAPAKETK